MKAVEAAPQNIAADIKAYEKLLPTLNDAVGKWALVYKEQLIGLYGSLQEVAEVAVKRFGRGPYLIRQIGAPPLVLPASVMFCPV